MDNYDDKSSHDTTLMLFQDESDPGQSTEPQFSQSDNQQVSRKLITELDSEKLVSCTKTKGRGINLVDFPTASDIPGISKGKFADDHFQWLFLRYKSSLDKTKETNNQTIPSFSSLTSILSETSVNITHITFTPILPYPATNYDAEMINRNSDHWNTVREEKEFDTYQTEFSQFLIDDGKRSEKFKYWNLFLDVIMPVMTDLTHSFRQADWKAYLSSLRRSIPLFFAIGKINYCRWAPIHYKECLNLENLHPKLFEAFNQVYFVVNHTSRRVSSVPVDQALEKAYNKPAKGPGGFIGLTRKKI